MALRHRAMEAKDVSECVELIATHPIIGPRYGNTIKNLGAIWLRLLDYGAAQMRILEQNGRTGARICFVGVSVCVTDEFLGEMKRAPFWLGAEFVRRGLRGEFPCLSDRQLREANSRSGLNLAIWEGCIRHGFEEQSEIHREVMNAFLEVHRGYLWKEVITAQSENLARLQWILQTGGKLWDPKQSRYVDSMDGDLAEFIRRPHVVGVTRSMERSRPASWVGTVFSYEPPRLGLSRSEQQLLLAALDGDTDEELSERLRVSLPAVKKKWLSVYGRVKAALPKLLPDVSSGDERSQRGKEKRRRLLAYLREHPEELRPVSRTLLRKSSAPNRHIP